MNQVLQVEEDVINKIDEKAKKQAAKETPKCETTQKALAKAKAKLTTAKKQMGKTERELVKYDDKPLELDIEDLKGIGHLQVFEKANLGLKMPKAE